jgi:ATP-dependent RNA helicase DeaD
MFDQDPEAIPEPSRNPDDRSRSDRPVSDGRAGTHGSERLPMPGKDVHEDDGESDERGPTADDATEGASVFADVPAPLRRALEERGFDKLTAVQHAIVEALAGRAPGLGRDLRISSQTGSGKTVALGLALAPRLLRLVGSGVKARGPLALVVVPTRELAAQVQNELEWLYAHVAGVRVDSVTGGTSVDAERQRLRKRPTILVGTPGRLVDHIGSGALDGSSVRSLVLDEADQMLDMGFRDDLDAILAALPVGSSDENDRRTHLLSATFSRDVLDLCKRFQNDPLTIEGTALGSANEDITHIAYRVDPADRFALVSNILLLAGTGRVLVFVATREGAATLADKLSADGFPAAAISGDLHQRQRTRTLQAFRDGATRVLVATDVAARGLDIPEVATVIQGDLPINSEVYTHRAGRTGRAGNKGSSILLVTPRQEQRARRLFHEIGVHADWQALPDAPVVQKAMRKRARRELRELLLEAPAGEISTADRDFAKNLLEDRDPVELVAQLLGRLEPPRIREPHKLQNPKPLPDRKAGGFRGARKHPRPFGKARRRDR